MIIIGGTASNDIHVKLSEILGVKSYTVHSKIFPDGESYVRLPVKVEGEDVVVVQSTYPPQDKHLVELMILLDAVKQGKAKTITAIIPYLAYARQDKVFLEGEGISVRAILKALRGLGVDKLIVVDPHGMSLKYFEGEAYEASAVEDLALYFKNNVDLGDVAIVAPDLGAIDRANRFAKVIGVEDVSYIKKFRDRVTGEIKMEIKELNVKGKDVIIVDDIISTGGTIAKATRIIYELGGRRVYAACTHPLLVGNAEVKLKEAGVVDIIATDSIPSKYSKAVSYTHLTLPTN